MPERVSLLESYNNKDVVTQIYRLVEIIDKSTYKSLTVSRDGNNINFVFTTNDDVVHTYAVPDAGIVDVQGSAVGSQVTIVFTMTDGTTKSFTYTATGGVTIDTDQTIRGMKVFSAASTNFSHDVDVGSDLNVGGTVEANELTVDTDAAVDGNLNIGGNVAITGNVTTDLNVQGDIANHHMAIEESQGNTVLSVDKNLLLRGGVTIPTSDSSDKIPDTAWVQNSRNADASIVRTTGNQGVSGVKSFRQLATIGSGDMSIGTGNTKITMYDSASHEVGQLFRIRGTSEDYVQIGSVCYLYQGHEITTYLRVTVDTAGGVKLRLYKLDKLISTGVTTTTSTVIAEL